MTHRFAHLRAPLAAVLALGLVTACSADLPAEPSVGAAEALATPSLSRVAEGTADPGSGRYVALGSSFASGPGLTPIADEPCYRSGDNYPQQVAAQLGLNLVDVSCGGALIDNVLSMPQELDPVRPPQLDAVTADTTIVTVTIGGNDVRYGTALDTYTCLGTGGCPDFTVDRAALEADVAALAGRLAAMLDGIADRAPDARVLLVTYPRIMPPTGARCPEVPLTSGDSEYMRTVGERLDEAFRAAALRGGAQVVDVFAASSDLGACDPDDPWVTGGLPEAGDPPGTLTYHLTPDGMAAVADLVVRALATAPR